MNADAAWYLYMAGRVLDGARPYRDILDTNPPLVVLVSMAAVGLARAMHLSPLVVFPATLFATTALSLAMAWRLSRGISPPLRQASVVVWAYLLLVAVGGVFGQREHILLILILPYAFSACGELEGRRAPKPLAIASGVMAGVGFAIKPFFVLILMTTELLLAWRRGWSEWKRPEALAILSVFSAYAATLILWTPEYFDVARRYAPLYPHYQPGGAMLLASSWRLAGVAAVIGLAWLCVRKREPGWVEVFSGITIGLVGTVYLTGKGWPYHWFPAVAASVSLLAGSAAMVASREAGRLGRFGGVAGLVGLVPILCILAVFESRLEIWKEAETVRMVRENTHPGDAVLVLTPWVHTSFPMINKAEVRWGMRHPMLWQIGAFYARDTWTGAGYHRLGEMSVAERRFVGEIGADFQATRPALLFVDSDPPLPALKGFDYLDYFAADPQFSRELANYEPFAKLKTFRVYRRIGSGPAHASASLRTARAHLP